MFELREIIDNIMALPLDEKAYLAEILIKDIDIKNGTSRNSHETDFRRIYRKNRNDR
ncbi:hypothetical protein QUF80_12590 [Desulfococcaceae bacterium HSG8]|nr:hypothetical protein [Desulfococcaceae bacterium HSG8]